MKPIEPQPLTPAVFHILLALMDGDKHKLIHDLAEDIIGIADKSHGIIRQLFSNKRYLF